MPLRKKSSISLSGLFGACIAVATSVPITAYLGASFGDTYNMRVAIYGGLLLWVADSLADVETQSEKKCGRNILPHLDSI